MKYSLHLTLKLSYFRVLVHSGTNPYFLGRMSLPENEKCPGQAGTFKHGYRSNNLCFITKEAASTRLLDPNLDNTWLT